MREFSDVTGTEGEASTLRCHAIGDPVPQITIRKGNETDPYQLSSGVSISFSLYLHTERLVYCTSSGDIPVHVS